MDACFTMRDRILNQAFRITPAPDSSQPACPVLSNRISRGTTSLDKGQFAQRQRKAEYVHRFNEVNTYAMDHANKQQELYQRLSKL